MREGIGSIALYNIIIIFIAVTFAILAGTMSYSKAFKVNNRIINAIEKYEGYNELSASMIDQQLLSVGYQQADSIQSCSNKKGVSAINNGSEDLNPSYDFCVYKFAEETREWKGRYSTYGVKTYINIDFPVFSYWFKIPVYGQSKMVFNFNPDNAPTVKSEIVGLEFVKRTDANPFYFNDLGILSLNMHMPVPDINTLYNVYAIYSDGVSHIIYNYDIVSGIDLSSVGPHDFIISAKDGEVTATLTYIVNG